jgi:thiamine-phosphate pyrophosphorylase
MSLVFPRLYVIMDASLLRRSELATAQMLAEAGVELIQFRAKSSSSRSLFEASRRVADFCRGRGVRFIVNDRPDVAALAGAGGVHVGQEDLGVEEARAVCGAGLWVGVSTHNVAQLEAAAQTSADYIAVGPIFETATKEKPDPVVGTELIRRARALTGKPLVAIGGITVEGAEAAWRAGADCVAVARDVLAAPGPPQRVGEYLDCARRLSLERR